jgi:hypothetical protein
MILKWWIKIATSVKITPPYLLARWHQISQCSTPHSAGFSCQKPLSALGREREWRRDILQCVQIKPKGAATSAAIVHCMNGEQTAYGSSDCVHTELHYRLLQNRRHELSKYYNKCLTLTLSGFKHASEQQNKFSKHSEVLKQMINCAFSIPHPTQTPHICNNQQQYLVSSIKIWSLRLLEIHYFIQEKWDKYCGDMNRSPGNCNLLCQTQLTFNKCAWISGVLTLALAFGPFRSHKLSLWSPLLNKLRYM